MEETIYESPLALPPPIHSSEPTIPIPPPEPEPSSSLDRLSAITRKLALLSRGNTANNEVHTRPLAQRMTIASQKVEALKAGVTDAKTEGIRQIIQEFNFDLTDEKEKRSLFEARVRDDCAVATRTLEMNWAEIQGECDRLRDRMAGEVRSALNTAQQIDNTAANRVRSRCTTLMEQCASSTERAQASEAALTSCKGRLIRLLDQQSSELNVQLDEIESRESELSSALLRDLRDIQDQLIRELDDQSARRTHDEEGIVHALEQTCDRIAHL